MSILILDGIDKTGKSTIAKKISDLTRIKLFHSTKPWKPYEEFMHAINGEYAVMTRLFEEKIITELIIDRFIASEFAYLEESDPEKNFNYLFLLDKRLAKVGVKIITFIVDHNVLLQRLLRDGEDKQYNEHELLTFQQRFIDFHKRSKCDKILVDTTLKSVETCFVEVMRFIGKM